MLSLISVVLFTAIEARHIKGGYIKYEYLGNGSTANTSSYRVTVTLFASCTENGPTDQVYLGIFDGVTNASIKSVIIRNTNSQVASKTSYDPCMSNPPTVCYRLYNYITTIELADNPNGYTLAVQDALRSANIVNMVNSSTRGITFTAKIPGTINSVDLHFNTSPTFNFNDTVIICYNSPFKYQFSATDPDGDSLAYSLGNGLDVTSPDGSTSSNPPEAPPYSSITYSSGYSGFLPLGANATINKSTGQISGTAPATTGEYVVAVYVEEWRKGTLIATTKKELQVTVANCSLTAADLKTSYINCDNFTFTFQNESGASNISSYAWDFGVAGIATDVSTQPTPTYTYTDTGTYVLQLKVTNSTGCTDSTSSAVKVYPGFTPAFTVTGGCYASPFYFRDATVAPYGPVNQWAWDFGDLSTSADVSTIQNPQYQYPDAGNRTATLRVSSSKGCSGTVTKTIVVNDRPVIELPFRDTLICSVDTLQLIAKSVGQFSWSPAINIINANTATPGVFPKDTITYVVTVKEADCINSDSIKVNVLDFITVDAGRDTSICQTDSIRLNTVSDALSYSWTPATGLSNDHVKFPNVAPGSTITYQVTANLGKCQDRDSITIRVSPYPTANAGNDTAICYGSSAQLSGTIGGAYYTWSPTAALTNITTLHPIAKPSGTTTYLLTVTDTFYCPKPTVDSIVVRVVPPVVVSAGNDTNVVIGQPLQLLATGATTYEWTPTAYLTNPSIANPVATIQTLTDSVRFYVTGYTPEGCKGSNNLLVKIFKTGSDIFVPSGFTPNGDGRNDLIKPILVGMRSLTYFRIYNRFGQMVFQTTNSYKGWDGRINGQEQNTGAFVYSAAGIDYLGNKLQRKGTVMLIR